jgi:hypothetical protein
MTSSPGEYVVRRSLWLAGANFLLAVFLCVLTLINLYTQWKAGESLATSALFVLLTGYFVTTTFYQLYRRPPQLIIGPGGLGLPTATQEPIAWPRIQQLSVKRRFLPGLGGQLDIAVDLETFSRLRFGTRFFGDFVVKGRGLPSSFTVLAQGLDRSLTDIEAAIKRHWPPDTRE